MHAGYATSCGVTIAGVASRRGLDANGRAGSGNSSDAAAPARVPRPQTWKDVIPCTGGHGCGRTTADATFCRGEDFRGELGNGSHDEVAVPTAVTGGLSWQQITPGSSRTCGVTGGGRAYCWGKSDFLGVVMASTRTEPTALLDP